MQNFIFRTIFSTHAQLQLRQNLHKLVYDLQNDSEIRIKID